MTTKQMRKK